MIADTLDKIDDDVTPKPLWPRNERPKRNMVKEDLLHAVSGEQQGERQVQQGANRQRMERNSDPYSELSGG